MIFDLTLPSDQEFLIEKYKEVLPCIRENANRLGAMKTIGQSATRSVVDPHAWNDLAHLYLWNRDLESGKLALAEAKRLYQDLTNRVSWAEDRVVQCDQLMIVLDKGLEEGLSLLGSWCTATRRAIKMG